MAITVKKATLWRKEVDPALESWPAPSSRSRKRRRPKNAVMGYRYPGMSSRGAIRYIRSSGRSRLRPRKRPGLPDSSIPTLVVEGENPQGLGHAIAKGNC